MAEKRKAGAKDDGGARKTAASAAIVPTAQRALDELKIPEEKRVTGLVPADVLFALKTQVSSQATRIKTKASDLYARAAMPPLHAQVLAVLTNAEQQCDTKLNELAEIDGVSGLTAYAAISRLHLIYLRGDVEQTVAETATEINEAVELYALRRVIDLQLQYIIRAFMHRTDNGETDPSRDWFRGDYTFMLQNSFFIAFSSRSHEDYRTTVFENGSLELLNFALENIVAADHKAKWTAWLNDAKPARATIAARMANPKIERFAFMEAVAPPQQQPQLSLLSSASAATVASGESTAPMDSSATVASASSTTAPTEMMQGASVNNDNESATRFNRLRALRFGTSAVVATAATTAIAAVAPESSPPVVADATKTAPPPPLIAAESVDVDIGEWIET